jgi:predicted metal-dependent phosphoesterase TrpH
MTAMLMKTSHSEISRNSFSSRDVLGAAKEKIVMGIAIITHVFMDRLTTL